MTTRQRLERDLFGILDDLGAGPYPDYIDDVLSTTARRRQRPRWTFPERWLPMAEITSRTAVAPRLPWRTLGVALLIVALLIAGAVAYIGSRRQVPPPFGVARNGFMALGVSGDVLAFDPVTGSTSTLVTGPDTDEAPMLSRDGTRLAFFRKIGDGPGHQLLVANEDGTGQRVISQEPITFDLSINWTADGKAIVLDDGHGHLTWLDAVGSAAPRKVTYPGVRDLMALRPPTEEQLLYRTVTAKGWLLQVMDVDGTNAHPLMPDVAPSLRDGDFSAFWWSPDGTKVAFRMHPDTSDDFRVYVVNADGTGLHPLTHEAGTWCECDMFWSPDGTKIAMNRWKLDPTTGDWPIHKVALVDVDDGTIREVGPMPKQNGAEFAFSPDGTSLVWSNRADDANLARSSAPILLDLATGTSRTIGTAVDAGIDWQRLAAP